MLATSAAVILALVLGLWVAYHAARALTTGIARASRGAHFDRAGQPGWFWFTVAGQIAIALGCVYLIVRLLGVGTRGGA
jgi:uncharacterized membrane protein HdeD (DUF308 family)